MIQSMGRGGSIWDELPESRFGLCGGQGTSNNSNSTYTPVGHLYQVVQGTIPK